MGKTLDSNFLAFVLGKFLLSRDQIRDMSGELRQIIASFSEGIFKASYTVKAQLELPMKYTDQLTRTYDMYKILEDRLDSTGRRIMKREVEGLVQNMREFTEALHIARTISPQQMDSMITSLEERIIDYESSNEAREPLS